VAMSITQCASAPQCAVSAPAHSCLSVRQCASAYIYARTRALHSARSARSEMEGQCAEERVSSLGISSTKPRKEYDR
jgi:hypothetical protein